MNAPAQQAAPAESKPPAPPQLVPQRMLGSEYARNIWVVTVEHGITREQFLQPAFWSLCAARLKPYDHVEVRCDDGTYWAELLVLDSSRTWARVRELRYVSLNTSDVAQSQAVSAVELMEGAYEVRYRGPHAKWGVVRVSDSALLKDGMQTKDEAESFRRDYLRTITA